MKAKHAADLATQYRITDGRKFRLKDFDPADTWKLKSKEKAVKFLEQGVAQLSALQEKLYAQDKRALLLIFQAMDAAGKDSTIKHVMSGVNPQGCQVFSFKAPTAHELDHDFLWRTSACLPERGRIGIFNRSYYEETLIVRVHPEFLHAQKLPEMLITKNIWKERFEDINAYERYLSRNGVVIRKFFLHVSKEEQRRRFLARLDEPEKNWKFSAADLKERALWDHIRTHTRRRSATPRRNMRRGTSSRRTTSGSPASPSRRRSSGLSNRSTSPFRNSAPPSKNRSPTRAKRCAVKRRAEVQTEWNFAKRGLITS
jgi:PPK2 family polyphosphate:nucleotide phosphotransferase